VRASEITEIKGGNYMKKLLLLIMIIPFLTGCGVAAMGVSAYNLAQIDAITELLVKKGILTNEEIAITTARLNAEREESSKRNSNSSGSFVED
jgi:hypothetical protein